MSYANGTQFYNLPQTVGTDKRDWFDTNAAFAAVDAALHAAATGQAADAEAISTINSKLAADEADIAALQTASSTQAVSISTLQTTVNGQATQIADVRQDAEDMITSNNEGAAATSTRAYAIGDYFIYNDVLYKATAAIAIGDTIVPNTNCEATNVDTEITEVKSALNDVSTGTGHVNSDYATGTVNYVKCGHVVEVVFAGVELTADLPNNGILVDGLPYPKIRTRIWLPTESGTASSFKQSTFMETDGSVIASGGASFTTGDKIYGSFTYISLN